MTDETAEKAAQRAYPEISPTYPGEDLRSFGRAGFIQGAEWGRASRDAEDPTLARKELSTFVEEYHAVLNRLAVVEAERDSALQALTESRARFGDMEQRALAAEAVIEKAAETIKTMSVLEAGATYGIRLPLGEIEKVQAVLSASPSSVLPALIREKQVEALQRAANAIGGLLSVGPIDIRSRAICDAQDALLKVLAEYRNGGNTEGAGR
ncbi:MAG: hypothetical protein JWP32_2866 [Schumannella sp.]|nr:hypothetical protein [Schumannella sp.]